MKNILTWISLFLLFQLSTIQAQTDVLFELTGEDFYTICIDECISFDLLLDEEVFWEVVDVTVLPNSGSTNMTQSGDTSYVICFFGFGEHLVIATGLGFDDNQGTTYQERDSFWVYVEEGGFFGSIETEFCVDPLRPNPNSDCHQACEYTTAYYEYISTGGPGQVFGTWHVTGAVDFTDLGNSVEVQWGEAGTGIVTFIPFNNCYTQAFSQCVDILPTPEPEFATQPAPTGSVLEVCLGEPVLFENLSVNATHYAWSFGDGAASTKFEPEHSYETPGTYTVELTAFNACDCEESITKEVIVLPAPTPELSCIGTVCPGEIVRYSASTDGCNTFHWNVNDGTILDGGGINDDFIAIEWNDGPDGLIVLLVEDCNQTYCSRPTTFRIPIVSPQGPIAGDSRVCSGEIANYSLPDFPGVDYNWNVSGLGTILTGQGTNAISIKWSEVNTAVTDQIISVTYNHCYHGCGGTDQFEVHIVPNMTITADQQFCENEAATFSSQTGFSTSIPVFSSWTLFDSQGNDIWSSASDIDEVVVPMSYPPGNYVMRATAISANTICEPVVEHDFYISPLPEDPLGIKGDSFICAGLPYTFQVEAAGEYEAIWTIVDGSNSFDYNGNIISHSFGNTPPYIVTVAHRDLIYTDCVSAYISKTLTPATGATILGPDEACLETSTVFEVFDLPGNIIEWRVEPADHGYVDDAHSLTPTIFWTKAGAADVILNVCGEDITSSILVHDLPSPVVNHPVGLCPNQSGFVEVSSSFENYTWFDEDDNIISTDSTVSLMAGIFAVEVTDENGCVGRTTFEIVRYPKPIARISTPGSTAFCGVVDPIELIANTDGTNYSYQWQFEGNNIPGETSVSYTPTQFGNYRVEVFNQYGCSEFSNTIEIIEYCGPRDGGICNGQCCNGAAYPCIERGGLTYTNASIDCNTKEYTNTTTSPITIPGTVFWDIEQPNGSYLRMFGENVQHTYSEAGYYTVVLLGQLDGFIYAQPNGCYHLFAFKDTVEAAARFSFAGGCANESIQFTDLSTFLPGFEIDSWSWDFGDGNTSNDQHPSHSYLALGSYNVQLTVTSSSGCTSTYNETIDLWPNPDLTIVAEVEHCENNPVHFELQSSMNLFNIQWDFDDASGTNNSAASEFVSHSYSSSGAFNPFAVASNIYGCTDTTSFNLDIFPNTLSGNITANPGLTICEGDQVDLIAPAGGTSWEWNTLETNESIMVSEGGYYSVIIEDDLGCQYAAPPVNLEVNPNPVVTINGREVFGISDIGPWKDTVETCEGIDIELSAFSASNVDYLWSNSRTSKSISFTNEAGNLLNAGTHSFTVEVTDQSTGCISNPAEIIVIVHPNPLPFTISLASGTGCSGQINTLQVENPEVGVTYIWSDGQVGTTMMTEESGIFFVEAINSFGCPNTSNNTLSINPSPQVELFPTGCFIKCDPDTICIPEINGVAYFEIRLNQSVVTSGSDIPSEFIASQSGDYELYAEGTNGCTITSEILSLELYPGFGQLEVTVFVDVNENGIIDAGDTTINDIGVDLTQLNTLYENILTGADGKAWFLGTPAGDYIASLDSTSIPAGFKAVIDSQSISIVGCDQIFGDSLLIAPTCEPIAETISLNICPGDSIEINGIFYHSEQTIEVTIYGLDCDTVRTFELGLYDAIDYSVSTEEECEQEGDGIISVSANSTNGPVSILWPFDGSTDLINDNLSSGTYLFELTDGLCSVTDSAKISTFLFPSIEVNTFNPDCPDDQTGSISIELNDPQFEWSLDSATWSNDDFENLSPGDYTVYITNGKCTETEELSIVQREIIPFSTEQNVNILIDSSIVLDHNYLDSVLHTFIWTPSEDLNCDDCIAPIFSGVEDTQISVLVTDTFGCQQQATIFVTVEDNRFIYIPNAFSPNDDQINDVFKPIVKEGAVFTERLQIFDRWGNRVYEEVRSDDAPDIIGWDGARNSTVHNPALFLYVADFIYNNGEQKQLTGEVHLIR